MPDTPAPLYKNKQLSQRQDNYAASRRIFSRFQIF